ncbi:toxin glutamine deamidase domain-containing protein [Amycolatopsis sp. cmx-4-68]|uniref:WXG100-like domain-containing protein n=1 Tax=Amycolatopsis sp. cmx-4-68 TaxID=2790938 RepID=UPI00397B0B9A
MEMPDAVKWLLPIVVGESWPEGDETKLRALRDAWHTASSSIAPASEAGNQAASGIRDNWTGDGADAFVEQWKKFVEGDEAYFKQLADATKALGDSCDQTALDVEYTKYMIIISLIVLAAQIAAMIAAAAVTFGGSTAGIAPAQVATRMTVQMLFRQLLEKLAQQGFKQVAKELLEKLLKQGLKKIGMEILKNEAINLGMDAGIQGLQMAKGDRQSWDWSKTSDAAISGAVGGVVGAASGSIGRGATEGLSHSAGGQVADAALRAGARGAVEGVAQTVGQAAVTGDLGSLTPEQLLTGASSGAVGGAVGGAKEQLHSVHEANIPGGAGGGGESRSSDGSGESRAGADEERGSSSGPESEGDAARREPSSEPESRREEPQRAPESRAEESRREPSSEPESRGEEPQRTSEPGAEGDAARRGPPSEPESRGEEPQRAPESRGEELRREASSEPEARREPEPRAESAPGPERQSAEPRPVDEPRPSSGHVQQPERPAAAPQPEVRAAPQPDPRTTDGPASPQAPASSAQPVGGSVPSPGGGMPSGTPHSSSAAAPHGGYGMAPPDPGRQSGGRPQDNVGAAGFTGGASQPFAGEAPLFQNGPSPQQPPPPPPGGFTPPPAGMPNGTAAGPGGTPQPPRAGQPLHDQQRRLPPQDPRRMLQGGQPPMPQSGRPPQSGQRPQSAQRPQGGQPPQAGWAPPGGQPPHNRQPPHARQMPQGGQFPHGGQVPPGGSLPGQAHNGQPPQGGQQLHSGPPTHAGQPPQGGQPPRNGQPSGLPPGHNGQPPQGGPWPAVGPPPQGGHLSRPGPGGVPSQGGVSSHDPRRMPPPQGPPVGGGQRPAGYPNQPRGPQGPGPHPGGRPPMPPPPGGRPPMPPHDPRVGPPQVPPPRFGPPQVPPPRFGPPQEHLPRGPQRPFDQPRPVDRAPEQPRMPQERAFEQPRPLEQPPAEPQPAMGPVSERPGEQTPLERSAQQAATAPERPAEHAPSPERPTEPQAPAANPVEQAPTTDRPAQQASTAERPAEPRATAAEPVEHAPAEERSGGEPPTADEVSGREEPVGDEHSAGEWHEPYLADEHFHADDPRGVRRIEDTFMDSGRHSPETGEWRHEQVRREALAKRDEFHPGMSDDGAFAVHAYTRYEMVGPLNRALRMGGPELVDLAPQAGALVSGLNEMPPHVGTVSRRIDFQGDPARLQAFLGRFHEGAHITEPSFLSSSKVDAGHSRSSFPGEVEMRISSKTGRDVESMASLGREREVLFKAGSQFAVTGVEMGPGHPEHPNHQRGEPQWVVHAEEVTAGDPRHLGEAEARAAIDERRAQERADEERFQREADAELEQFYAEHPHLKPNGDLAKLLGFDPEDAPPPPERRVPATGEPAGGWSQLAEPLTPGGTPVLHAGSVETPQQHARLVRDAVPELGAVNTRNHYGPEPGFRTNSAESMVAFERRMNGEDVVAGPSRQQGPANVSEQLGGQWRGRDSFGDVAHDLGERPIGARAAVAFQHADGERLVAAVHTEHGVVFADPVTGRLAELPPDAAGIRELPLGGGETPGLADRLNPAPERLPHDEGYLFDGEHRGTPADHDSIRRAVGDEGIYQQIHDRALARRDAAGLPLTDEAAVAVHGYTRGEYAYDVNEALRRGPGHPGFDLAQANARAITDGLNQVPRTSGETIRAFDVGGDPRLAELVAGPYEPGAVVVEPSFSSASIKTGEFSTSKFGDDVELHVRSDNLRDISKLAENPSEREALSPPGTQLLMHDKRLEITPEGRRKWVIEAEEIGPGHPRYLDPEAAQQKMAERRAENDHNAAEFERRRQAALMERLGGFGEPEPGPHHQPEHPKVSDVLDGPPEPPVVHEPQPDYSGLARATNPPAEPAIHADAATPAERAAYVQDRHPHLREVNPGFHQPGALENGYLSNCTRGPEAYWDRLHGGDATAEPIPLHEMGSRGTLEHIEGRFGETFSERGSYDDVIREVRGMPVDHHAVVAVKYEGPNGVEHGHVAMVVHTRDGVAFIDPQSGDLMHLPQPPKGIKLMHIGTPDEVHVQHEHAETTAEHGGYGSSPQARLDELLVQPRVAEALAGATTDLVVKDHEGNPQNLGPVGEFVRTRLASHPELVDLLHDPANEFLTRSLLRKPETIASLLVHDEAIPILADAVHEVHHPDPDAEPVAPHADPTPLTPEQAGTSREVLDQAEDHPDAHRAQAPFDLTKLRDEAYTREYLAERYREAARADLKLKEILPPLAEETGGHAGFRPGPKSEGRAMDKINTNYNGDASLLVDLAGAMIQFERVQDAYAALARIAEHPDLEIVDFDDRFANPAPAGYRDLQMSVRIDGHVAELRLHLKALDDVSAYEHSLYEVRRDLKALAKAEGRSYTDEERALIDGLVKRERELFWDALQGSL